MTSKHNGFRVREMDVSEIPEHIIANMKRIIPDEGSYDEGLTMETLQESASSKHGGVWILRCPKDLKLSSVLPERKISLEGKSCVLDSGEDDEYDAQDPSSLVKTQYEATTVASDEFKDGAMIVLPGSNQFKLVTVPIQGHIVIRERVKELQLPEIKVPTEKPRKLPDGVKERHPVYGSDFTKILEEMEVAPTKKKRKKSYEPETAYPNGFTPTYLTIGSKSKTEIESDDLTQSVSRKKKKKKDKHRELEETEVISVYENGYSDSVHHNNINEDSNFGSKKKSKKRKRGESEEPVEDLNTTILIEGSESAPKKSKKSKNKYHDS